jgi:hypothetical protein
MQKLIYTVTVDEFNKKWSPLTKELLNEQTHKWVDYYAWGIAYKGSIEDVHQFQIIDDKKWLLTKIKHGL